MKINRLLELTKELLPTTFGDDVLLMWLSNCENTILTEVLLAAPENAVELTAVTDAELLVPHPYDKLYLPYMEAQICHAMGEVDRYVNFLQLYNAYRDEFARWICRTVQPGNGKAERNGYYLSAYALAVKHGYVGTEAQWVQEVVNAQRVKSINGVLPSESGDLLLSASHVFAQFTGDPAVETVQDALDVLAQTGGGTAGIPYDVAYGQLEAWHVENETFPEVKPGEHGKSNHKGKGKQILVTFEQDLAAAPMLSINGGAETEIRKRGSGEDLTLPIESGELRAGVPYLLTFCGKYWLVDSWIAEKGNVRSVNGFSPDNKGNVEISAEHINPCLGRFVEAMDSFEDSEGFSGIPFYNAKAADGSFVPVWLDQSGKDDDFLSIPTVSRVKEMLPQKDVTANYEAALAQDSGLTVKDFLWSLPEGSYVLRENGWLYTLTRRDGEFTRRFFAQHGDFFWYEIWSTDYSDTDPLVVFSEETGELQIKGNEIKALPEKLENFHHSFLECALDEDGIVLPAVNTLNSSEGELLPTVLETVGDEADRKVYRVPTVGWVQEKSFGTLPDGTEEVGYCNMGSVGESDGSPNGSGIFYPYITSGSPYVLATYPKLQGKQIKEVTACLTGGLSLTFLTVRRGTTGEYRKLFTLTGSAFKEDGTGNIAVETFDLTDPNCPGVEWQSNVQPGFVEVGVEEMLAVSPSAAYAAYLWANCYTEEDAVQNGYYSKGDVSASPGPGNLNIHFVTAPIAAKVERIERKSTFEGKTLAVLGDSISTFSGWNPAGNNPYYNALFGDVLSASQTWWKRAADALGMNVLINDAEAAGLCTNDLPVNDSITILSAYNRVDRLTVDGAVPEVIWLEIGTNDFLQGVALGTYDGTTEPAETPTTFREAFARTLLNLQTAYPAAKICACTILPTWDGSKDIGGKPSVNAAGIPLASYNAAIREISAMFGVEVIDFATCGINYSNLNIYMGDYDEETDKAIHPNAAGHALMANAVIKTLDPFCRFRSIEEV